jgi:integration host factor subunit beta
VIVTKSELIKILAKRHSGLYQKDINAFVELVFNELIDALKKGNRIELRGFGAFSVRSRASRVARNPRTNEVVNLGERFVPYFRAGKELRTCVNAENDNNA